ncbi:MAG TPA: cytochrome P450 [Candidatus Dormibacteraeota bacterium]
MATRLDDVDLVDPDVYAGGVPHETFALLRREAPVYRHPQPGASPFWAITRYRDVVAVSRDSATFSSERRGAMLGEPPEEALAIQRLMMLNMDPPRHTKLRGLINKGFTPRVVALLTEPIRRICAEVIDAAAERGECDFVTEISAELPLQVIAELLGVPQSDRHQIFEWSNTLVGGDDPEFRGKPEDAEAAAIAMYAYANDMVRQRMASPRDDLVSALMQAEVDGERLTETEFDLFFLLLAVAGNETTRNLISGGMLALIQNPDQWRRLRDDPSLLETGVEEMLRWVTPVMQFQRTAQRDTEIAGVPVAEGDRVALYYVSANRDEAVFEQPDRFDVGRSPNEHVAFSGGGPHFCLGANLARLEIRIMFEELLQRAPVIEPNGPPRKLRSSFLNGIKSMPVRLSPA